jgi:hypothetical protein
VEQVVAPEVAKVPVYREPAPFFFEKPFTPSKKKEWRGRERQKDKVSDTYTINCVD